MTTPLPSNDIVHSLHDQSRQLSKMLPKGTDRRKWTNWSKKYTELSQQIVKLTSQPQEESTHPIYLKELKDKMEILGKKLNQLDQQIQCLDVVKNAKQSIKQDQKLLDKALSVGLSPTQVQLGPRVRRVQNIHSSLKFKTGLIGMLFSFLYIQGTLGLNPTSSLAYSEDHPLTGNVVPLSSTNEPGSAHLAVPPKVAAQLQSAETLLSETQRYSSAPIESLKKETERLYKQLLQSSQSQPPASSPAKEKDIWEQHLHEQCFALETLENRLAEAMDAARKEILPNEKLLEKYGKKHLNIVLRAALQNILKTPGVAVPLPKGISTDQIHAFLYKHSPAVFEHWKNLQQLHANDDGTTPFLQRKEVVAELEAISQEVDNAFVKASRDENVFADLELEPEFLEWLKEIASKDEFLMVRSTGSEDSRQTANAGGNVSKSYVKANEKDLCLAMGGVVKSYFSYSSLNNRLNAGVDPFNEELRLAVTVQELIGEPVGGATNLADIPISLVLFSNEPLFIGTEKFRVMRMSATYGHGEGVVGNQGIATDTALILQSEVDPEKLYVIYDNQYKSQRLAPIQTDEGIVLGKINNPEKMANRPALNHNLISRLFHEGIVTEKFFDKHPTDEEIVIKKGTIHTVQARPINRPDFLPTYLDPHKLHAAAVSPVKETTQAETLVSGNASVVVIHKREEILIADTLEEAEKIYRKEIHKLVVVAKGEPANSHPVVNFSSLGVPCLYIHDKAKLSELSSKIKPHMPLVTCMQTATINTWDSTIAPPDGFISKGFAVHPAKVAISLPLQQEPLIAQTANPEIPQEVRDLILAVRSSTTSDVALAKLGELQQHGWIRQLHIRRAELEKKIKDMRIVPQEAKNALETLRKLDVAVKRAFRETKAAYLAVRPEEHLKRLLHVKILETLLFKPPKADGSLGQYSVLAVKQISETAEVLIDYQRQLSCPAEFADLMVAGRSGVGKEAFIAWKTFLLEVEELTHSDAISSGQIAEFRSLITSLQHSGAMPFWTTFFFQSAKQATTLETFQEVLSQITSQDRTLMAKMLKEQQQMKELSKNIEQFANPETFESAFTVLQEQAKAFEAAEPEMKEAGLLEKMKSAINDALVQLGIAQGNIKDQMSRASRIGKTVAAQSIHQLIDLYDTAIKTMKASPHFSEEDKVKIFKRMLNPYFTLVKGWGENLVGKTVLGWSFGSYFDQLAVILENTSEDPKELFPSLAFDVSESLASRGSIGSTSPTHLEDIFTLLHQNGLLFVGSVYNQQLPMELLQSSLLPPIVKEALQIISQEKIGRNDNPTARILSIQMRDNIISAVYNLALGAHSVKFIVEYNVATEKTTLRTEFAGGNECGRWDLLESIAQIWQATKLLKMAAPIETSITGLSISYQIERAEEIKSFFTKPLAHMILALNSGFVLNKMHKDIYEFAHSQNTQLEVEKYLLEHPVTCETMFLGNSSTIYANILKRIFEENRYDALTPQEQLNLVLYSSPDFHPMRTVLIEYTKKMTHFPEITFDEFIKTTNATLKQPEIAFLRTLILKASQLGQSLVLNVAVALIQAPEPLRKRGEWSHTNENMVLMEEFINKGQHLDIALKICKEGIKNYDGEIKLRTMRLAKLLLEQNYAVEEIFGMAQNAIIAVGFNSREINLTGKEILSELIKKDLYTKEIKVVLIAAAKREYVGMSGSIIHRMVVQPLLRELLQCNSMNEQDKEEIDHRLKNYYALLRR